MAQGNVNQRNPYDLNDTSQAESRLSDVCSNVNNANDGPPRYNSVQEYARTLQHWMWNYHCMASVSSFYSTLPFYMSSPFQGPNQQTGTQGRGTSPTHNTAVFRGGARGTTQTNHSQGTEYLLPSVWKRFAAEVIDFFILFYIKLIVSVGVMRQMGILESDHLELEGFYRTVILSPDDVDLDKIFALTSEIIALEIVNRICITIVETLCLRQGVGVIGGATPGKRILGLCVVSCQDVTDLGEGRIRVRPAQNIGLKRALVRSVIKNFTLAFFFPACLTIFFFHHNRAAYDVISGTIVVQNPENQNQQ